MGREFNYRASTEGSIAKEKKQEMEKHQVTAEDEGNLAGPVERAGLQVGRRKVRIVHQSWQM